ncbi:MAG: DUF349 domain-containing protein [Tannerellaceae bacterium]|jgi:hypothetical protein|nr:DUF349 domain-containing protein [Tannerellaceae bacterium]
MKDTHETNLPTEEAAPANITEEVKEVATETSETPEEVVTESSETPEEVVVAETSETPEEVITEASDTTPGEVSPVTNSKLSKEEILDKLAQLVYHTPVESVRNEVELLKQAFYKIHRSDIDEQKRVFLEGGGTEEDFVAPEDGAESRIKELLSVFKEKRASLHAEEEQLRAANYALKLQLIGRLKEISESQEDFNKLYNEFKDIQQRWKEAKLIPQEHANELWRNYQIYSEKFYDIIKINNQFRDYDFKKNLELKTALCETVERLQHEPDAISAFHQLQKLHQQWREIGPVAKELREDLWTRFKAASTIINKQHQSHFESQKEKEQENLKAKIAICDEIESIDYSQIKTFKDWERKNREMIALQEKWKNIGFAPKKYNVKIFERFRAVCDVYFEKKNEFYKSVKDEMTKNLEQKRALCEKAEALKDSTDWSETTEKMIALQKEWKTIGQVGRKQSEATWKRFITACDYFFEQKNKNVTSQKSTEQLNLKVKRELIEKVHSLDDTVSREEAVAALKEYMAEWNATGFVPFKEKDKIYKEFHEAVDKQFDRLKVDQKDRKMQTYRSNLTDMAGGEKGKGKLYGEREKLMRAFERMKNELQTYENNIGFLSVSSKGGGGLIKEMEQKIEKIKEEMNLIVRKIDTIDETLE